MHFNMTIECRTVAFDGNSASRNQELANILIAVAADLLEQRLAPGGKLPLRDRYGHSVGIAELTEGLRMRASGALQTGQAQPSHLKVLTGRLSQRDQ
ncbi:MAG: hypothetical protein U1E20_09100 [Methylocystis sp.]|uniref:hypothetical protein n=1 Tax=Methylocystis sp. TaxID=1911079 RepID=UPI003921A193